MKKITFLTVLGFTILSFMAFAQNKTDLVLSSANPSPGEKFTLKYTPQLKSNNNLNGYLVYITSKMNFYQTDLNLTLVDETYNSEFSVPDSAVLIGFVFKNKKNKDDKGDGYSYALKNANAIDVKDANIAMSMIYEGLGDYLMGIKVDKEKSLKHLNTELELYPAQNQQFYTRYYKGLVANKEEAKAEAVKTSLLKSFAVASEKDKNSIYSVLVASDKKKADSLKNLISKEYPKGYLASDNNLNEFYRESDLTKKEAQYNVLMNESNSKINKDLLNFYLATAYANEKKYDKVLTTLSKIKNKQNAPGFLNSIAWTVAQNGPDFYLPMMELFSKTSLDYLEELKDNKDYLSYMSKSQKEDMLYGNYIMYADTYAFILAKEGKIAKALTYQEEAAKRSGFNSTQINERYTQYLLENKLFDKAEEVLVKVIANNKANEIMYNQLKELYLKSHTEVEYTTLLDSLLLQASKKAKDEMVGKMINTKAPAFSLTNLNGETVSLTSLKGKVVIVDFWATWCGPCKASFPGMQMAVNKFKDDKNVAFVFVNTWERISSDKRKAEVSKFITDNKYTFNVLMDTQSETDKNKYDIVSAFGVDGIPTKFILDKNGYIRFKVVGFSEEGIVGEITTMIDLASNPPSAPSVVN